ncbi:hypothetical protein BT69DRAFT_177866 [Atractiella rhizophila]|nr:hypothetical protein BT69DRAFT_177866 [Atractiella rhizophila]
MSSSRDYDPRKDPILQEYPFEISMAAKAGYTLDDLPAGMPRKYLYPAPKERMEYDAAHGRSTSQTTDLAQGEVIGESSYLRDTTQEQQQSLLRSHLPTSTSAPPSAAPASASTHPQSSRPANPPQRTQPGFKQKAKKQMHVSDESESDSPPVPAEHETNGRAARDRLYIDEKEEGARRMYRGLQGAWQRVSRDLEEDHDPDYDSVEDDWWSYDELQARLRGFQFPERGNPLPKVVRWVSKEAQAAEEKKRRATVPMEEVFQNVGQWRKGV